MDNISLIRMEAGNLEDINSVLSMFIDQVIIKLCLWFCTKFSLISVHLQYNECFKFENFEKDNIQDRLWTIVFKHLEDPRSEIVHELCLKSVRILR